MKRLALKHSRDTHLQKRIVILFFASVFDLYPIGSNAQSCFFAVTQGVMKTPIAVCDRFDPSNLLQKNEIQLALKHLKLEDTKLALFGCPGAIFHVMQKPSSQKPDLQIFYPSDHGGDLITPILHELGHVYQIVNKQVSSGEVQNLNSKRLELGADNIAGALYWKLYPSRNLDSLATNTLLSGLYKEDDFQAHGTPAQRDSAFRMGFVSARNDPTLSVGEIYRRFQRDQYAILSTM